MTTRRAGMQARRWVVAASALLWAGAARANGGSSDFWLEGGVAGSLRPKQETTIRLVSETLKIAIDRQPTLKQLTAAAAARTDDGGPSDGYRVEARYVLENPGPPARALYAVPIVVTRAPFEDPSSPGSGFRVGTSGEELARRVRVAIGGKSLPCEFVRRPTVPWAAIPDDLQVIGGSLVAGEPLTLDGSCAVPLEIPRGRSELTLTYAAELFGSEELPWSKECEAAGERHCEPADRACQKERKEALQGCPPKRSWSDVWLYYPLGAASTWAGTPDFVRVEVALGGFELDRKLSSGVPEAAAEVSGVLRWTWQAPNLAGMDFRLALSKRGSSGGMASDSGAWCEPRETRVRASSSIAGQGDNVYDARRAVDGEATTAWCVNTPKGGVGEWIELEFPLDREHAFAPGLFLVPGYAKSQKAWTGNGRVSRVRYGPCGAKDPLREATLAVAEDFRDGVVPVEGSAEMFWQAAQGEDGGKVCVRIEIAATIPGARSKDVCVSEIRAPLLCW